MVKNPKERKTMLRNVLITCFSLTWTGCIGLTGSSISSIDWDLPPKPKTEKVDFISSDGGYFLTELEAEKLADNIDEIKAYADKLEILINEMIKYYE